MSCQDALLHTQTYVLKKLLQPTSKVLSFLQEQQARGQANQVLTRVAQVWLGSEFVGDN